MMLTLELDPFSRTPRLLMTNDDGFAVNQMSSRHIVMSNPDGTTVWEAP
jgi:hypothetical protein